MYVAAVLSAVAVLVVFFDGFTCHDARGDGDDGVTKEHDNGGDELACGSDRSNVAVAYGGDSDNGPINSAGNTGYGGIGFALNAVHGGTEDHRDNEDKHHKDENLHGTAPQ